MNLTAIEPSDAPDDVRLAENERAVATCLTTKAPVLRLDIRSLHEVPSSVWHMSWLEELSLTKKIYQCSVQDIGRMRSQLIRADRTSGIPMPLEFPKLQLFIANGLGLSDGDLCALAACSRLRDVELALSRIESLDGLAGLVELHSVCLGGCDALQDVSALAGLSALQNLSLSGCTQLQDVDVLTGLAGLESLSLRACTKLRNIDGLAGLRALHILSLEACRSLPSVAPLAELGTLQHLNLGLCSSLQDLTPLAKLTALRSLVLQYCSVLQNASVFAKLRDLERLDLRGCRALREVTQLKHLTELVELDLSLCSSLTDLTGLSRLVQLRHLKVSGCSQVRDSTALASLSALRTLSLAGCTELSDVTGLADLTSLEHLELRGCQRLQNISGVASSRSLQHLDLRGCSALSDLAPLARLTSVKSLDLSLCNQLTDITALSKLTALEHLDLSGCSRLQSTAGLSGLTRLETLDLADCRSIDEVNGLAKLCELQELDLSGCESLRNVYAMAGLRKLRKLSVNGCSSLRSLAGLGGLSELRSLRLNGCDALQNLKGLAGLSALVHVQISSCPSLLDLNGLSDLRSLKYLTIDNCRVLHTLDGAADLSSLDNVSVAGCPQLRSVDALAKCKTLRRVCLSNTGVGFECHPERSLLRSWPALEHLSADRLMSAPAELRSRSVDDNCLPRIRHWQKDLTQGAAPTNELKLMVLGNGSVGKTQLCRRLQNLSFDPTLASTHGISLGRFQLADLEVNFWDFGGQDVYLGTHALFLDEHAVYVLAWTPEHERSTEYEELGVPLRDRPLQYWLDYIRSLAGDAAPVIVVQTKCDRELDVVETPLAAAHRFKCLRRTACSAKRDDGMEPLVLELRRAVRYLQESYAKVELPATWTAVAAELRAMRESGRKLIDRRTFDAVVRRNNAHAAPQVVLTYLHRAGQMFWRDGAFADAVILDLAWVFDAVYAVLDRQRSLPLLRQLRGRFSMSLLAATVWTEYSADERALFLQMMLLSEVCFELAPPEPEYIAPALLPPESEMTAQLAEMWRCERPTASAELRYTFLHEAILRSLLCTLGRRASLNAVYWSYGVCFWDADARGVVQVTGSVVATGEGAVRVDASGILGHALVERMLELIRAIRIGEPPTCEWIIKGVTSFGDVTSRSLHAGRAAPEFYPAPPPHAATGPISIWVSYAWQGESEALVDEFERRLDPNIFVLRRDRREMKPGESIDAFMSALMQGELVLVVLSDKYARSQYCMRELLGMSQHSGGDRRAFNRRVVPIVCGDLQIATAAERDKYVRYWGERNRKLDALLDRRGKENIGQADLAELKCVKEIAMEVSDLLAWAADVLIPSGAAGLDAALRIFDERSSARS